ncbi:S-layer homology domain-containing protein [Brevibacillus marinus]|uniref:S-layer homology domain-containing protein n=1 Tax=Brevibacillus marinus TaxID=2496837 RepID=UPI0013DF2D6D|nr:S-layer homology domain-containing protein [Brevibacillus marinus]
MKTKQKILIVFVLACLLLPTAGWARAEQAQEAALPFRDIEGHWAAEEIQAAYQAGLLIGVDGSAAFRPDQLMSRGEFMVLIDRLFLSREYEFFALTLLTEHDEYGWGEGFDEPYLPYRDVDRLTWLYPSVRRLSLVMERLYGPGALQEIFPGDKLYPDKPITQEEAEALFRVFTISADEDAYESLWPRSAQTGKEKFLRRAEAAVAAIRLSEYLEAAPILPLLDESGQKYPLVPEISELFPLFDSFFGKDTAFARKMYHEAVERIRVGEETETAFRQMRQLAASRFSNQVGVQYYLSWDDQTPLAENLRHAYLAVDEYFQAGQPSPEVLRLLAANVYDLALQLQSEQPTVMRAAFERLRPYLGKLEPGSAEWLNFSLYLAALEARSGEKQQALERYLQLTESKEGLTNALYYLVASGRMAEADELLAQASDSAQLEPVYADRLRQELTLLARQAEAARQLAGALQQLETSAGIVIRGQSMLNGYQYRYTTEVDRQNRISHTAGIYQAPDKLVLQKMESYTDMNRKRLYLYDYDAGRWEESRSGAIQYIHEWLDALPVEERLHTLRARYLLQQGQRYAVVTEWIPQATLQERSAALSLPSGELLEAPAFVSKYYIDRNSGQLVKRVWRYEEFYESGEYIAFWGEETYSHDHTPAVELPADVTEGGR